MKLRKLSKVVALAIVLSMTTPSIGNMTQVTTVEAAAKVQLSATKKTIKTGESFTLKVNGTTQKVSWSSSKTKVATVSKTGKVTGKGEGSAVITAKVSSKKYTCKVTVKKGNKYLKGAPFDAKEVTIGKYSAVVPGKWKQSKNTVSGTEVHMFTPEGKDVGSNIMISTTYTKADNKSFNTYVDLLKEQVTKEYLESLLSSQSGTEVEVSDYKFTTEEIDAGKITKITYSAKLSDTVTVKQTIYDLFADGYTTEITVSDGGEGTTPDLNKVADYLLKSLTLK